MNRLLDRQRWIAVIAVAVAVPLPFTGVVSIPFLIPYLLLATLLFLSRQPIKPLPVWVENIIAPVILVLVVAAGGWRFGILRPVAQLAVSVAAVRLPGAAEIRRLRSTISLLALVGLAGIASSTHPLLAVYLLALLALIVVVVGHFAMIPTNAVPREVSVAWPPVRLVAATVGIAVVLGAPLFVTLPRLRSPFAASPFGSQPVSGFRDAVALHRIGDVKESSAVALRVRFPDGESPSPEWLRLAGVTLQRYRGGVWAQSRMQREKVSAPGGGTIRLADVPPRVAVRTATVTLEKPSDALFAELGVATITTPPGLPVWRGPLGELTIPRRTDVPLTYETSFVPGLVTSAPPSEADLQLPAQADAVGDLAQRVAGKSRTPTAAAIAVESYLRESYAYSTSTSAPLREDPVNWFLFEGKAGHCEFFASAMVIMLRTLGIPARMQAGYAGGDRMDDGSFLVRDRNAHAWVIAWIPRSWADLQAGAAWRAGPGGVPESGSWRLFDPTPADGRPGIGTATGLLSAALAWENVERLWDRWVLTFSMADQLDLVRAAIENARSILFAVLGALAGVLVLWSGARVLRRVRPRAARARPGVRREPVGAALAGLRDRVRDVDGSAVPGITPRQMGHVLAALCPAAARDVAWLVDVHERVVFGGESAPPPARVRAAARRAARELTRAFGKPAHRRGPHRSGRPTGAPRAGRAG